MINGNFPREEKVNKVWFFVAGEQAFSSGSDTKLGRKFRNSGRRTACRVESLYRVSATYFMKQGLDASGTGLLSRRALVQTAFVQSAIIVQRSRKSADSHWEN